MWVTVLVLGLMAATDPVRIGIAALLISRPRPLRNLLAFWLGGMATGIPLPWLCCSCYATSRFPLCEFWFPPPQTRLWRTFRSPLVCSRC
jgi:hypothetical protein